jgi:hypothetical protein
VEDLCRTADYLTLRDSYPPGPEVVRVVQAQQRLGQQLRDPEFVTALDLVSRRVCGVPLVDNPMGVGELLRLHDLDTEQRMQVADLLLRAFTAMAGGAG